jgi:hypothetical protein
LPPLWQSIDMNQPAIPNSNVPPPPHGLRRYKT